MSYGDPKPQHRNAIQAVSEARQKALNALSMYRREDVSLPHQNLAPIGTRKHIAVECNQAAADYFLQLRPYRSSSATWSSIVTDVYLPREIPGGESKRLGGDRKPPLRPCRMPRVQINGMSDLLEAINTTVTYSTNYPISAVAERTDPRPTVRLDGDEIAADAGTLEAFLTGDATAEDVRAVGEPVSATDGGETDEFRPATPDPNATTRKYKIVFGPDTLVKLAEAADEIAAEMDLLAELEPPDHAATGDGAV